MSTTSVLVQIEAEAAAVWPWIADLMKHSQWSPHAFQVELVSGVPGTVGARYRSVGWVPGDSDHENQVEVTEVVENRRFVMIAHDKLGDFTNTFELSPNTHGTDVKFTMDSPPMTGFRRLLFPVAFPLVVKPDVRKRLGLLKAAVEGEATV